jgi:hypothetical protein
LKLGETNLEFINYNTEGSYDMPVVKCSKQPVFIDKKPNDWKRRPARYFEIGMWEQESGGDAFAGIVSMTAYPSDFIQCAANSPQAAKPLPLDQRAKDAYLRGDMEEVWNNSHVIFYKQGSDNVAEYTIYDPGYHLEYVKFRIFMEVWYN